MNRAANGHFLKGHKLGGRTPIYDEECLDKLAEHLFEWITQHKKTNKFALLSEWCFEVGVNPRRFAAFSEKSAKFKEAYEWAKAYQEFIISHGALQKQLEPRFSQFFLAVNHNWLIQKDTDTREEKQKSNLEKMSNYLHNEGEEDEEREEETQ